jgi:nitrogen regulatory protein PII
MQHSAPAKLVTIIVSFEVALQVEEELERRGIRAYSVGHVEGRGRHGHVGGGLIVSKNVEFRIVTKPPAAAALLEWVATSLSPVYPGIAWEHDITAAPASIVR